MTPSPGTFVTPQDVRFALEEASGNKIGSLSDHALLLFCYQYDPAGNLTQKTDNRGTITTYIYDDVNRLTNRNYLLGVDTAATPNVQRVSC